jgi:hypothetical protein
MSFLDRIALYRRGWVRFVSVALGVLLAAILGAGFDFAWYWGAAIIAASAVGVPLLYGWIVERR